MKQGYSPKNTGFAMGIRAPLSATEYATDIADMLATPNKFEGMPIYVQYDHSITLTLIAGGQSVEEAVAANPTNKWYKLKPMVLCSEVTPGVAVTESDWGSVIGHWELEASGTGTGTGGHIILGPDGTPTSTEQNMQFADSVDGKITMDVFVNGGVIIIRPVLNLSDTPTGEITWVELPTLTTSNNGFTSTTGYAKRDTVTDPGFVYLGATSHTYAPLVNSGGGWARIDIVVADCSTTNTSGSPRLLEVLKGLEVELVNGDPQMPATPAGKLFITFAYISDGGVQPAPAPVVVSDVNYTTAGSENFALHTTTAMSKRAFWHYTVNTLPVHVRYVQLGTLPTIAAGPLLSTDRVVEAFMRLQATAPTYRTTNVAVTGTSTKTITLTLANGATVSNTFTVPSTAAELSYTPSAGTAATWYAPIMVNGATTPKAAMDYNAGKMALMRTTPHTWRFGEGEITGFSQLIAPRGYTVATSVTTSNVTNLTWMGGTSLASMQSYASLTLLNDNLLKTGTGDAITGTQFFVYPVIEKVTNTTTATGGGIGIVAIQLAVA